MAAHKWQAFRFKRKNILSPTPAVRCWPWGVFSQWLASRDIGTARSSYLAWVEPVVFPVHMLPYHCSLVPMFPSIVFQSPCSSKMYPGPFVPQWGFRVHIFHKCVSPVTVYTVSISTWSVSQYIRFTVPIVPVPMFLISVFPSLCSHRIFPCFHAPQSLYSSRPLFPTPDYAIKCFQSLCSPKIFPRIPEKELGGIGTAWHLWDI